MRWDLFASIIQAWSRVPITWFSLIASWNAICDRFRRFYSMNGIFNSMVTWYEIIFQPDSHKLDPNYTKAHSYWFQLLEPHFKYSLSPSRLNCALLVSKYHVIWIHELKLERNKTERLHHSIALQHTLHIDLHDALQNLPHKAGQIIEISVPSRCENRFSCMYFAF